MANPRQHDYRDFYLIPNLIFKLIGYDFLHTSEGKRMQAVLRIVRLLIFSCHMYLNYSVIEQLFRSNFEQNLMDIIRLSSNLTYAINSNIKFFAFVLHRKLAYHIYDKLREAYPKTVEEKNEYQLNSFYWSRLERVIIIIYIIACWNVVYSPLLVSAYIYTRDNMFPYFKCYHVEYDFNFRTPLRFVIVYLIEGCHSHYMIMANWGTDLWLISFTSQICIHFAYIARSIENYEPKVENSKEDCAFLVRLINKHQVMLSLHNDLNKIFGISLAFNLISTTGVFCIVAVRLIVEGLGIGFFSFCVFLVSATAQFYMVCYYGQKLSEVSESIATAAYIHCWYNASADYKKMLSVLIIRSQKQAQLLAVGLEPLSMDTFKTFMGSAYRISALLQTVLNLEF